MAAPTPSDIPLFVAAIGALGVASFGIVEALGKALFVFDFPWFASREEREDTGRRRTQVSAGLPYVGFDKIRRLTRQLRPALKVAYGDEFDHILRQQYRAGRGQGQAPDTIRQGVRLGLPFLEEQKAAKLIGDIWGLPEEQSMDLARALTVEKRPDGPSRARPAAQPARKTTAKEGSARRGPDPIPEEIARAQALAARFATALDTRVQAAFDLAEEVYQTRARAWAAVIAIGLSLGYEVTTRTPATLRGDWGGWFIALLVGMAAVPLAPMAKDLASSLSDALGALGKLRVRPQG